MSIRKATAQWNGTLKEGNGTMNFSNYKGPFTFASRFEEADGTNPEELIGAAHAGCYSMFLSALISKARKAAAESVVKYGFPVPAANITILLFSK